MVLNEEQFAAFSMEIATFGNIPISSQYCGIGCLFCKVHTDYFLSNYPEIPQIDEDDLLKGFEYVNPNVNYVRLGAGVLVAPHTDPFLHPKIYDFIKLAAEHFPTKTITTVTTGAYIQEDKLDFLNSINNYGIDLSLITMQERRELIVPRSMRDRTMTLLKYAPLNKCTLIFTGKMEEIKNDIELLYRLNVDKKVKQILVRRMEHTKYSSNKLKLLSNECINNYEECISWIKSNYPKVVFTVPKLLPAFRGGSNEYFEDADRRIKMQKLMIKKLPKETFVNIICSESTYDYFTNAFKKFPNVKTNLVLNHMYGGSVTVSGLLNHKDIKEQFQPQKNDVMLLPCEMYNSINMDLTGEKMVDLEKYYNAKIILS